MANGERGTNPLVVVGALAGLGGLGYVAYRYWYLPGKMRNDLQRYAAQSGLQPKDALARLGAAGCMAFGAKYGLPPQASGSICNEMGQVAADLARQLPQIVGGTLNAVGGGVASIGGGVGSAVGSIGGGIGQAAAGIGTGVGAGVGGLVKGVTGGLVDAAKAPIQVAAYGVGQVYGGVKTVVTDVGSGVKTVISDVGGAVKDVFSGIASIF